MEYRWISNELIKIDDAADDRGSPIRDRRLLPLQLIGPIESESSVVYVAQYSVSCHRNQLLAMTQLLFIDKRKRHVRARACVRCFDESVPTRHVC